MSRIKNKLAYLILIVPLCLQSNLEAQADRAFEILRARFPGASTSKQTVYLSKEEKESLEKLHSVSLSRVNTFYLAVLNGRIQGFGIFDTHRVRTKEETLFIITDENGIIKHVEVIAFLEPSEYMAPVRWLALLTGRSLSQTQPVQSITGSTLTVRSVTLAIRRTLVLQKHHFQKPP